MRMHSVSGPRVSGPRVSGTSVLGAAQAVFRAGLLAGLLAAPLVGCTLRGPESPAVVVPAEPDPAETFVPETLGPETRLIEAAERAELALASLARAVPASGSGTPRYPASAMPDLDTVPAALRRPVTLDWAGPLESLARALAQRAGYRFFVAGRPPARPPIVAVEARGRPLLAVLRDAGLRAGGAATLIVDASAETVTLDWTGSVPSIETGDDP